MRISWLLGLLVCGIAVAGEEKPPVCESRALIWLHADSELDLNTLLALARSRAVARKALATGERDPAAFLALLRVERVPRTRLAHVTLRGRDPAAVTARLGKWLDAYRDAIEAPRRGDQEAALKALLEQRQQADKEVREHHEQVRDYRRRYPDVVIFDRHLEFYADQMKTLRKSSTETMIEIAKLAAQVNLIKSLKSFEQKLGFVRTDLAVEAVLKEGERLRLRLTGLLLEGKRDEHVDVKNARRDVEDNHERLKVTVEKVLAAPQRHVEKLQDIRDSLWKSLLEADQSLKVRSQTYHDYRQLELRQEKSEERLEDAAEAIRRHYAERIRRPRLLTIVDPPELVKPPLPPRRD